MHQINHLNLVRKINDDSRETYNTNSQIKFTIGMLNSSLYDYSDASIFVKGRMTTTTRKVAGPAARQADERGKEVIFKNCTSFTNCMHKINNTQLDNAKDLDVLMLMHNLIEYSDNY